MSHDTQCLKKWLELWRLTDNVYTSFLKRWDLSLNAYFVLYYLHENPDGVEPAHLAELVNVQRQLVTLILRDFEARKFIVRKENKTDRRRKSIRLSKPGKAFADEVCGAVNALDLQGLSVFTPEEQDLLVAYSERFYQAIRTIEAAKKPSV